MSNLMHVCTLSDAYDVGETSQLIKKRNYECNDIKIDDERRRDSNMIQNLITILTLKIPKSS